MTGLRRESDSTIRTVMRTMNSFCPRSPWAFCCLLIFCALTTLTYMGVDWYLADPARVTSRGVDQSVEDNVDFRYEIAAKLRDVTIKIKSSENVNPEYILELNKIVSQLDPRFSLSTSSLVRADPQPVPDTCGEEYKGNQYGYPWYRTGFVEASDCKRDEKLPINELATIVLLDRSPSLNRTEEILQSIRNYNDKIPIILGSAASLKTRQELKKKFQNVILIECDEHDILRPGKTWNFMIGSVKTPYAVVAKDVFYFNDLARLERQIYVISSTNFVGIAGGAFRNETGFWKIGCHLTGIKSYVLKYTQGYQYSAFDCMFCDHLEGPFVVKTFIAKKFQFHDNLFSDVLFEDWFLKIKQKRILVMNCPDVMYFKSGVVEGVSEVEKIREHSSWLELAREWEVDRVVYPSRITVNFTCAELKITCDATRWFKAFIIPSCCMDQVTGALRTLDEFSKEKGVEYEIDSGTLLGAVKMGYFLPWDKDGDIAFMQKDYKTYYENSDYFSDRGYSLSMFETNRFFRLNTPEIILEMWGQKEISKFQLPSNMWEFPTRLKMNGIWVRGVWNPGLFARNRYGPDVFKHVQHWNVYHQRDSWQLYEPGSWLPCPKKAHHGCLDQYPTDGSVGFLPDHIES